MRFIMMIKATEDSEAGIPPKPELLAAIGRHSQEAFASGTLVDTAGLAPSSQGARVRVGGGKVSVIDGPFAEAKELIGGYAIVDAPSREEAIRLGREFMQLHADVLGKKYAGEMEIRQLFGPQDSGPPGARR
jgi:hypothetical protein